MEKDFSFYPSHPTALNRLTPEQVETYNRDGYIKRVSLFEEDQAVQNRTYFDGLLRHALSQGKNSYSISGSHVVYGGVFDLVTSPPFGPG